MLPTIERRPRRYRIESDRLCRLALGLGDECGRFLGRRPRRLAGQREREKAVAMGGLGSAGHDLLEDPARRSLLERLIDAQ